MKQNEVHHGVILQHGLMGTALQNVPQHDKTDAQDAPLILVQKVRPGEWIYCM